MSTDLIVAFVSARLDEDEAAANEIHRPRVCGSVDRDGEFDPAPTYCSCDYPARVRREVAAGRAILAEAGRIAQSAGMYPNRGNAAALIAMQTVLKILAAVWSDHPDYRPVSPADALSDQKAGL